MIYRSACASVIVALIVVAATAAAPAAAPAGLVQRRGGPAAFDSRAALTSGAQTRTFTAIAAEVGLRQAGGDEALLELDPLTGTVRVAGRLDGFLTAPSKADAMVVALGWARQHAAGLGLDASIFAHLRLVRRYVSIDGTTHLVWAEVAGGIEVFGNDFRASVSRDGRLINVLGSPLRFGGPVATTPTLTASGAYARAVVDGGGVPALRTIRQSAGADRATQFADGGRARLVLFASRGGAPVLSWKVVAPISATGLYDTLVDAGTGRILYRQNLVKFAGGGLAWQYYPSSDLPAGVGSQAAQAYPDSWLAPGATKLAGNNAHVYPDTKDNDRPDHEIAPGSYAFTPVASAQGGCSTAFACSWDAATPYSWQANLNQVAAQVFYYVNKYHDHLAAAPIGFTEAAGNFQTTNFSGQGKGGDALNAEVGDGANSGSTPGLPDADHVNNANMATQADGIPPRMQMYLFADPTRAGQLVDGNGGDEADIVYHEYTHGLSSRLVTYADGTPALDSFQSASMGEAWSDWYAMDYLVAQGYDHDTATVGDVRVGRFIARGGTIRSEPLDCSIGDPAPCVDAFNHAIAHGGYTYADVGRVAGSPEVHADGEVWAQTLWQIRRALSTDGNATSPITEQLVTRAMELSPVNPSFLDMRNALLQADVVDFGGAHAGVLWSIFAQRGMGYYASTVLGDDTAPVADFSLPPGPSTPRATVTGTVRDTDAHLPVAHAIIVFGGHSSGLPGDLTARTDASGRFAIRGVPVHTWRDIVVLAAGYDDVFVVHRLDVTRRGAHLEASLRRDWAAPVGGAAMRATGGAVSAACSASFAVDGNDSTGWVPTRSGATLDVRLPRRADLVAIAIDPVAFCPSEAHQDATGRFELDTSRDGRRWMRVVVSHFTLGDDLNPRELVVPGAAASAGVTHVRIVLLGHQRGDRDRRFGSLPGLGELRVYAVPAARRPPRATDAVRLSAPLATLPAGQAAFALQPAPKSAIWYAALSSPNASRTVIGHIAGGSVRVYGSVAPSPTLFGTLASAPGGAVWFPANHRLGLLTGSGRVVYVPLPGRQVSIMALTSDGQDGVWLGVSAVIHSHPSTYIAHMTAGGRLIRTVLRAPIATSALRASGAQTVWFGEANPSGFGLVRLPGGERLDLIISGGYRYAVTSVLPDPIAHRLWFLQQSITDGSGALWSYDTRTGAGTSSFVPGLQAIERGPDGRLWLLADAPPNTIGKARAIRLRELDGRLITYTTPEPTTTIAALGDGLLVATGARAQTIRIATITRALG